MPAPTVLREFLALPEAERKIGPCLLVRQLGRGGFAPVWLAKEVYGHEELRTLAVKLFGLDGRGAEGGSSGAALHRDRVLGEARALCRVEHPNVVRFYALFVDDTRGLVGLAMEHVAGATVGEKLDDGPLPLATTLAVGIAVASALAAVHRAGLVHRDVKPANVVEAAGIYKLIDFGIASADSPRQAPRPQGPEVMDDLPIEDSQDPRGSDASAPFASGTLGYIDPTIVASDAPAAPASDLYSLGAMLFECVTGKLPAAAASPGKGPSSDVLEGRARAPALASLTADAPAALCRLVDAMLAPARDERPSSAEAVALELERIRAAAAGRARAMPPEDVGPFRGLSRFEQSDHDVYFGRGVEVALALEMLRQHGLVALIGPSGSGKSSLARAGLLPAVMGGALGLGPKSWDAVVVAPGADPRAAIAAALEPWVPDAASRSPEAIVAALESRTSTDQRGLILLVDPLEELVTQSEESARSWTERLLARLSRHPSRGVRLLATARRDLLDPLLALPDLGPALVRGSLLVSPLGDAAWTDVLDQALTAYGYAFEDDLSRTELLAELRGTAGAMPLVAFALTRLWQTRDATNKRITRAGLRGIGGVAGALERHAEAIVGKLERDALEAARAILLALTTPQGTRRTADARTLEREAGATPEVAREVIRTLEEARLVVREEAGLTLAHEAMLTQWSRLRGWVAEAREDRVFAEEIAQDAARWDVERDDTLLWKKRRLAAAEDLLRRRGSILDESSRAFLEASRNVARRLRRLIGVGLAAAAVASVAVGVSAGRTVEVNDRAARGASRAARMAAPVKESNEMARALHGRLTDAQSGLAAGRYPDDLMRRPVVEVDLGAIASPGLGDLPPRTLRATVAWVGALSALDSRSASLRRELAASREKIVAGWAVAGKVTHSVVFMPDSVGLLVADVAPVTVPFEMDSPWPGWYEVALLRQGKTERHVARRWVGQAVDPKKVYGNGLDALPVDPGTLTMLTGNEPLTRVSRALDEVLRALEGDGPDRPGVLQLGDDLAHELHVAATLR